MRFAGLIRSWQWWVILVATIGAAGAAGTISLLLPGTYRAEATLAVNGPQASRELQLTYAEILTSNAYLAEPAEELGLEIEELREGLRAIPAPGTTLIAVTVDQDSEDEAVRRAAAVADGFAAFLDSNGLGETASVAVIRMPEKADQSSSFVANTIGGAAAGLLCAIVAVSLANRRRGAEEHSSGRSMEETGAGTAPDEHEYVDSR